MLELKKSGLYIANGKNISVLVRIAGTAPCLVAVNGTITVLEKDSLELQDIVANPKSYVFDYPSVSEAVKNALGLEATERTKIEYTEQEFNDFIQAYKNNRKMFPVVFINKGFSKSQADMIIAQIETRLRLQGEL